MPKETASEAGFEGGHTFISDDDRTLLFSTAAEVDAEFGLEKAEYSCIDDPYGDFLAKQVRPPGQSLSQHLCPQPSVSAIKWWPGR